MVTQLVADWDMFKSRLTPATVHLLRVAYLPSVPLPQKAFVLLALTCVLTFIYTDGLRLFTSFFVCPFICLGGAGNTPNTSPATVTCNKPVNRQSPFLWYPVRKSYTLEGLWSWLGFYGLRIMSQQLPPSSSQAEISLHFCSLPFSGWEMGHRRSCQLRWAGRGCTHIPAFKLGWLGEEPCLYLGASASL